MDIFRSRKLDVSPGGFRWRDSRERSEKKRRVWEEGGRGHPCIRTLLEPKCFENLMSEKHVRKYDFGARNLIDFGSISEPFQYEKSTAKQCEKNTAKTTKYYEKSM